MQTDEEDVFGTNSNTASGHLRPLKTDESYELYASKTTASLETPPTTPSAQASKDSVTADNQNDEEKRQLFNSNDDHSSVYTQSEADDDSSLVFFSEGDLPAVAFEPPYTAPLAPLLPPKEWKRKNTSRSKTRQSTRSKNNVKSKRHSPAAAFSGNIKSYDSLCAMFIYNEKYASASGDAGSELEIGAYDDYKANGRRAFDSFRGNSDGCEVSDSVELDDILLRDSEKHIYRHADKR